MALFLYILPHPHRGLHHLIYDDPPGAPEESFTYLAVDAWLSAAIVAIVRLQPEPTRTAKHSSFGNGAEELRAIDCADEYDGA